MSIFSGRNNSKKVVDVVRPSFKEEASQKRSFFFRKKFPVAGPNLIKTHPSKFPVLKKKKLGFGLVFAIIAFCVIGVTLVSFELYNFRREVVRALEEDISNLSSRASDFKIFGNDPEVQKLFDSASKFDLENPIKILGTKVWPLLKNSVGAYDDFQSLTSELFLLMDKAEFLVDHLFEFALKQKGNELIKELEEVKKISTSIIDKNSKLATRASGLKEIAPLGLDFYLPFQSSLARYDQFLTSFLAWLKAPVDHHLFVMILNPSEIRPSGGFLGSYADLVISGGHIKSIDVHDINDLDRAIDLKIIPPEPIQVIATKWKTADANWFFDFPSSAKRILQFAESSSLYNQKQAKVSFDGSIAITGNIIEDILKITGPLKIPDTDLVITSENFLLEIQEEIQTARENQSTYPKEILKEITPLIFEKLTALDDLNKKKLFSSIGDWISKKDLMIYFKDQEFQNFLSQLNLAGEVYPLPQNFIGNYLAVVNSNIGGNKTDLFINQKVNLVSQIEEEGIVKNHLTISREHGGNKSKYWWHKTPNQNYLQVFTLKDASLENASGGIVKKITQKINYKNSGYLNDPLVVEIESTKKDFLHYPEIKSFQSFGKNIFSTWTKTDAGKKTNIVFDYIDRLSVPLRNGSVYQFIFEKQAGSKGEYNFELHAPVGFVFRENKLPVYEYKTTDPPARVILNLTLEKLEL